MNLGRTRQGDITMLESFGILWWLAQTILFAGWLKDVPFQGLP